MDMEQHNERHGEGEKVEREPAAFRDESDAMVEMARIRRVGRGREVHEPRPAEAIGELPEDLRPFSRYLAGRDARPTSMRANGRGTRPGTKRRVGFDYVHSMVDDRSRLAFSEVLPDEKGATCAAFLVRAASAFREAGIERIEEVMTDNAKNYTLSRDFQAALTELGARHVLIRPHCPWQNGKVERFNRTLQVEWAYRRIYTTNALRTRALASWLRRYNTQRPHGSLGGRPPISRLSPT